MGRQARKLIRFALPVVLAISATGCAPDLTALANDHNALCARWTWVYGSGEINRNHGCDKLDATVKPQ